MGRLPRRLTAGQLYHVTVRGNNRQSIFGDDLDRREYLMLLADVTHRSRVVVHAFVLMPNHVHLLAQPLAEGEGLSRAVQRLNATYAKYMNRRYERIGHLFQGRFHSTHVDRDTYLLVVSRYIHNNPVRAGLVRQAIDFPWSSVKAFTGELDLRSSHDRLISRLVQTGLTLSLLLGEVADQPKAYLQFLRSVSDTEKLCQRKSVPDTEVIPRGGL